MAKLSRNTLILGVVSFLNDLASEMVYPVIPIFLTGVLGASTGVLGLVEGIAEGFSDLLKLIFGKLSDRFRRNKPFVLTGYLIASISRPLMGLSTRWEHLLFLRFLDRAGKGVRTSPRDKIIHLSQDPNTLGFAFSFHRAMDHMGAVFGPLAAYFLMSHPGVPIRYIFFISAAPAAFVILLLLFIREAEGPWLREEKKKGSKGISLYMTALLVFSLGNASDAFIVLLLSGRGFSVVDIPLLWALFNLVKSLLSTPMGILSDRMGRKKVVGLGWFVYFISYLLFPVTKTRFLLVLVLMLYGSYYAMTEGVEKALLGGMIKRDIGSYYGLFHFVKGMSLLTSSVVFGLLWERFGVKAPFWLGAGLSLVALLILSLVKER